MTEAASTLGPIEPTGLTADGVPLEDVLEHQKASTAPDEAWTPALPTLRAQQMGLRRDLMDGFGDREELLLWCHAAAAVSMGHVPPDFAVSLVNNRWRVAACLKHQEQRDALCEYPPSERDAHGERQDVVEEILAPGFQAALRSVSRMAADYTDTEDGVENVEKQRFIAMRPRLHQHAVSQHEALCWAMGRTDRDPLTDRDSIQNWVDYCGYSCAGRLPTPVAREATSPYSDWWGALLDNESEHLTTLLAMDVLPAMIQGQRSVASDSEENPRAIDDSADVDPRPTEAF